MKIAATISYVELHEICEMDGFIFYTVALEN